VWHNNEQADNNGSNSQPHCRAQYISQSNAASIDEGTVLGEDKKD